MTTDITGFPVCDRAVDRVPLEQHYIGQTCDVLLQDTQPSAFEVTDAVKNSPSYPASANGPAGPRKVGSWKHDSTQNSPYAHRHDRAPLAMCG